MSNSQKQIKKAFKKTKRILVWSFKGGVGKTKISLTIAKELGFGIITNEPFDDFALAMKKGTVVELPEDPIIHPDILELDNIVYDFGGKLDARIAQIAPIIDYIVIPFFIEEHAFRVNIHSLNALNNWKEKLILVANKVKNDSNEFKFIKDYLNSFNNGIYSQVPLFALRESKFFNRIYLTQNNASQILNSKTGYSRFFKSVVAEVKELAKHLTKVHYNG